MKSAETILERRQLEERLPQQRYESAVSDLETTRSTVASTESALSEQQAATVTLREAHARLEAQCQHMTHTLADRESAQLKLDTQFTELKSTSGVQIDTLTQSLNAVQGELNEANTTIVHLQSAAEHNALQLRAQKTDSTDAQAKIALLAQSQQELEHAHSLCQKELQSTETDYAIVYAERDSLHKELAAINNTHQREREQFDAQLRNQQTLIDQLQRTEQRLAKSVSIKSALSKKHEN